MNPNPLSNIYIFDCVFNDNGTSINNTNYTNFNIIQVVGVNDLVMKDHSMNQNSVIANNVMSVGYFLVFSTNIDLDTCSFENNSNT